MHKSRLRVGTSPAYKAVAEAESPGLAGQRPQTDAHHPLDDPGRPELGCIAFVELAEGPNVGVRAGQVAQRAAPPPGSVSAQMCQSFGAKATVIEVNESPHRVLAMPGCPWPDGLIAWIVCSALGYRDLGRLSGCGQEPAPAEAAAAALFKSQPHGCHRYWHSTAS